MRSTPVPTDVSAQDRHLPDRNGLPGHWAVLIRPGRRHHVHRSTLYRTHAHAEHLVYVPSRAKTPRADPLAAGPQIFMYKTLSLHMPRPYVKRAAGVAMLNSLAGISNIWTAYIYSVPGAAPHYYVAFGTSKCPFHTLR